MCSGDDGLGGRSKSFLPFLAYTDNLVLCAPIPFDTKSYRDNFDAQCSCSARAAKYEVKNYSCVQWILDM